MKNYYTILELPPSATPQDVKKAYRRLALKYHPDRNPDNEEAESSFKEIQEAYHILSHPERRSAYNQRRWYRHHTAGASAVEALTPALILKKTLKLRQYIRTLDAAFLNRQELYRYICDQLLGEKPFKVLQDANDHSIHQQIITELLQVSRILPYQKIKAVCARLQLLAGTDVHTSAKIDAFVKQKKLYGYWEKYQQLVVVLITLIVCWLIYVVSK